MAMRPEAGPPRLETRFGRRLRTLALLNAPLFCIAAGVAVWVVTDDRVHLAVDGRSLLGHVALLLACCLVMAFGAWVLLPVARWLRAWPVWHFRHRSRLLWALPAAAGWTAWLALWLVSAAVLLAATGAIVAGLWHLATLPGGVAE